VHGDGSRLELYDAGVGCRGVALVLAAFAGCYRSHPAPANADAGAPVDARPPAPDAEPPAVDAAPVDAAPPLPEEFAVDWEVSVARDDRTITRAEVDLTVDAEGASHLAWIGTDIYMGVLFLETASVNAEGETIHDIAEVLGGRQVDFDPTLCTTTAGTIVLAGGCYDYADIRDGHLCVSRSVDGGATFDIWSEIDPPLPPVPGGRLFDRPWLACTTDGAVVLVYSRFDGDIFVEDTPGVILMTVSDDDAVSWRSHEEVPDLPVEFPTSNVAARTLDRVQIGVSDGLTTEMRTARVDATSWPPAVTWSDLVWDQDHFPALAAADSGEVLLAGWRGSIGFSADGLSFAAGTPSIGNYGEGPDVTCLDVAWRDGCYWAAWLQGDWYGGPAWQTFFSRRCADEDFRTALVVPDEDYYGTPHPSIVDGQWLGHFIGIDVAPDGSARAAWVDSRDGRNTVWLARITRGD